LSFIPSRKIGIIVFSNTSGANRLQHLIANYAYNLIAGNTAVEKIFDSEKKLFVESFKRSGKRVLPAESMPVKSSKK